MFLYIFDASDFVDLVLLELTAVFNAVDHQILISHLALNLLMSYLTNIFFFVRGL